MKFRLFLSLLLLLESLAYSQSPTCDIAAIRAAFAAQGHYTELVGVSGQPCSLYFINTISQDASQSEIQANALGAHTAVFDDAVENANVNAAINAQGFGGAIWIGYHRTSTASPTFYALDGTTGNFNVPTQAGIYQNWAGGEPNNNGYNGCTFGCNTFCSNTYRCQNGEQCVQIYSNGQWNDLPCNTSSISLVEVNLCPVSTASADQTICAGQSANITGTNGLLGSNPYTYSWTPTTNVANPNVQNTTASPTSYTSYTLTITDRYSCTGTSITNITVNTANANAGQDASICAGSNTQLNAAAGGTSYAWSPSAGLSNAAIANPIASPTVSTTYTVSVLAPNGCTSTDDVIISVNPSPNANAGNDAAICVNGSAFMNATGAGTGGTYSWSPVTSLSDPSVANPVSTPTTTITYTVTITDVNNCVATDDITISVNQLPTANAGADLSICTGSTVTLGASGGVSYSWTPPATLDNSNIAGPIATPTSNTTYTVTVTDANNCSATDDVIITLNQLPVADAGADAGVCSGLSITLNATGGNTYSWSPITDLSNSSISSPVCTPTSTTTYTVTVTDANNCSSTDDIIITLNNLPLADAGNDATICLNGSAFLNASGGLTYSWSPVAGLDDPNVSTPIATPISTITYTVTVTDANNCINTDDVTISVNPLPTPNAGVDQSICIGDSANLSTSGFVSYTWSPAASLDNSNIANPVATPAVTTTYTVSVIDANNCIGTDDIIITVNPLPTANAGADVGLCDGLSVGLSASGGVSYSWSPISDLSDTNIANPIANPTVNITYTVTVTDANNCVNTDDIDVTVNSLPLASAGLDTTICFGTTASLSANSGFVSYDWSPTSTLSGANSMTPIASPNSTTTYVVIVTDINGCQDDDSMMVTVVPTPTIDAGTSQTICYNGNTSLQGSANGVSYSWTPASNLSDSTILTPTANPSITTTYTLTVTDANNCTASDQVQVIVNPTPYVNFSASFECLNIPTLFTPLCTISSGSLSSFSWDFGEPLATSTDNDTTLYVFGTSDTFNVNLSVTSDLGCAHDTTIIAVVNPLPQVSFSGNNLEDCIPQSSEFINTSSISSGSNTSFYWNFGNGQSSTEEQPTLKPVYPVAGNYSITLTVNSDSGCQSSVTLTDYITRNPLPVSDFVFEPNPGDILLNPRIQFTDISLGSPQTWDWNFGQGGGTSSQQNPYYEYTDTGMFDVRLVTENGFGCIDTVVKKVYIAPSYTLYVPNTFTPSGDKVNEKFFVKGIGIEKFDMVIMDRWGHEVFRTKNINEGWDGTLKDTGNQVKQDYYTYQINIRDFRDYPHQKRGTVLLVR